MTLAACASLSGDRDALPDLSSVSACDKLACERRGDCVRLNHLPAVRPNCSTLAMRASSRATGEAVRKIKWRPACLLLYKCNMNVNVTTTNHLNASNPRQRAAPDDTHKAILSRPIDRATLLTT